MIPERNAVAAGVIALILIAAALAAGLGILAYSSRPTTSFTSPGIQTTLPVTPTTTAFTQSPTQKSLYGLTFKQLTNCASDTALANQWLIPWEVTLSNGMSASQPPGQVDEAMNATLGYSGTTNSTYSLIAFLVPNGTYGYTIRPAGPSGGMVPSSGSVTVNGQNVTVDTDFSPMSCGYLVTTTSQSSTASSDYWSDQPYLNASTLYAALGYPKVTYNDYSTPYLPGDPSFIVESSANTSSQAETSDAQVTSFSDAVQVAAAFEKLNPSNYTLGEAVFAPGTIFNGTMTSYPQWFLYFAQITDGYWLLGDQGPYSLSIEVNVDALNGAALGAQGNAAIIANAGQYDLAVNSSTALEAVRTSSLPNVSADLTENGAVSFLEPRVVVPGQYATTNWIDSHLSGQSRLLWIINLQEPDGEGVLLGSFAVDAGNGSIVAGSSGQGYEP